MKKLFFVLFLFLGISVQSFAFTVIEEVDIVNDSEEHLQTAMVNDLEVVIDEIEIKNALIDEEDTTLSENGDGLFDCSIHNVHCMCGFYETQYCTGGSHGTIQEWEEWICGQSECDDN